MHAVVRLHDLVDDYLLRDGNDVCIQTVVSPTTLTPIPTTTTATTTTSPPTTPRHHHHHHLANMDVRRSLRQQQQQQQQYLTAMTAKSATSAAAVALTVVDNRSHMIHAAYGKTVRSLYVGSALNSKDHHDDELDNDGDYDDDDEDNYGDNNNNNSRGHNGGNRGRGRQRRQKTPGRISVHLISELNVDVDITAMHVAEGVVAAGLVNGHMILHDVYNSRNNTSILNNHTRSYSFSTSKSLTTHHHHAPPKKMRGHSSPITAVHVDAFRRVVASASHDCTVKLRRYNFQQHHSSPSSSSSSLSSSFSSSSLRGHGTPVRWIGQVTASRYATHGGSAGDGRLKLWDVVSGICTSTVKLPHAIDVAHIHSPFLLPSPPSPAVSTVGGGSSDGADIYVAAGPSVHVVDSRVSGGVACILSVPRAWGSGVDRLGDMTVDPHDGTVAAAVGEGGVILWDGRGSWEGRGIGQLHLHNHHHHSHHRRWTSSSSSSSFRDRQLSSVAFVQRSAVIATAAAPHVNDVLTFSRDGSHTGALFVKDESWRAIRRRMLRRRRRRTDPSTSATPTVLAASRRSGGGGLNSSNVHDDEEVQALQAAIVNVQTVDVGVYDDVAVVVTRRNGVVTLLDVANSPVDWDAAVDTFVDLSCTERDRDREQRTRIEDDEMLLTSSTNDVDVDVFSTRHRIADRVDVQHAYAREQSTRFWNGAAYLAQQEQTNDDADEDL